MAWNGSNDIEGSKAKPSTKTKARKPSPLRGIVAGALVVALAVGAYFAFFSTQEKPQGPKTVEGKKPTAIKEVVPAKAGTPEVAPSAPKKVVEIKKLENGKIMKYVDGKPAWMYPRKDYHGPVHTGGVERVQSIEDLTFRHPVDRRIASLLLIEPGEMLDEPYYDKTFTRAFLRTLDDPEIPLETDTPEQRELKRAVAGVKGELKARYDAGEDIMQVLCDAQEELRQLGAYKEELAEEVRKYAKDGSVSAEDVQMYVDAANKMLEKRGLTPMKVTGFIKHQIRVKAKMENANKE